MRTENDLRAAFHATAEQTTMCADMITRAKATATRRQKRRTVTALTAIVVAIGLLVPLAFVAFDRNRNTDHNRFPEPAVSQTTASPSGTARPSIAFPTATVARTGLMTIPVTMVGCDCRASSTTVDHVAQRMLIMRGDGASAMALADLILYSPGRFDATTVKRGRQIVTADSGSGYIAALPQPSYPGSDQVPATQTLAWEYQQGSWAVMSLTELAAGKDSAEVIQSKLIALAAQVQFEQSKPFLVPLKFSYLPAGTEISSGETNITATGPHSTLKISDTATGNTALTLFIEAGMVPNYTPNSTIGGHPTIDTSQKSLFIDLGTCQVLFSTSTDADTATFPVTEMRKIAAGITGHEAWNDPNTWYDYRTAAPNN
jgi:hypothetical protein